MLNGERIYAAPAMRTKLRPLMSPRSRALVLPAAIVAQAWSTWNGSFSSRARTLTVPAGTMPRRALRRSSGGSCRRWWRVGFAICRDLARDDRLRHAVYDLVDRSIPTRLPRCLPTRDRLWAMAVACLGPRVAWSSASNPRSRSADRVAAARALPFPFPAEGL